mgnify:CR=1 FL=1
MKDLYEQTLGIQKDVILSRLMRHLTQDPNFQQEVIKRFNDRLQSSNQKDLDEQGALDVFKRSFFSVVRHHPYYEALRKTAEGEGPLVVETFKEQIGIILLEESEELFKNRTVDQSHGSWLGGLIFL